MRLFSIHDKLGNTSTFFPAENADIAKRQYLLSACHTPFWKDFELRDTGIILHDDGFATGDYVASINNDLELNSFVIECSQDEIDSFIAMIERQKVARSKAYEVKK